MRTLEEAAVSLAHEVTPETEVKVVGVGRDAEYLLVLVTGLPADWDGHRVRVVPVNPPQLYREDV